MSYYDANNDLESTSQPDDRSPSKLIKRNFLPIKLVGMGFTWVILLIIFIFIYNIQTPTLTDIMSIDENDVS
ncbi:MAG: hypothetical protein ACTSYF_07165 [Promethearchaeota archaeon]